MHEDNDKGQEENNEMSKRNGSSEETSEVLGGIDIVLINGR